MQVTTKQLTPTNTELTIAADPADLTPVKTAVLKELARDVKMAGFRKGHAPEALVEKNVDQQLLQGRFLDAAVSQLYTQALVEKRLRPVAPPSVNVTKFVPFTTLEFTAAVEVLGEVTLADYKKFSFSRQSGKVTDKEVAAVVEDLRARSAEKHEVQRAAKDGDEVVMDFTGLDAKTKEPIDGAAGKDYPLVIGSNTFIPGFEPELIGLKSGEEKSFVVTFPKDYGAADLQNKKVSFTVQVKKVNEVSLPEVNDAFAAKLGPKTVADLKTDIRAQLEVEKANQAERMLENDLLGALAEKSKLDVPTVLVEEEVERMLAEEKQNLLYRGQTWQEHLEAEGKTEEEHRAEHTKQAEIRVKSGLVLGEVAQAEGIDVSEEELDQRIAQLKQQYSDAQMQAELDKPENRRDIASRILTEKTIELLKTYAVK
ncbi:MAG: trigger factor [Candidatus Saccharimonadales bacterium]